MYIYIYIYIYIYPLPFKLRWRRLCWRWWRGLSSVSADAAARVPVLAEGGFRVNPNPVPSL